MSDFDPCKKCGLWRGNHGKNLDDCGAFEALVPADDWKYRAEEAESLLSASKSRSEGLEADLEQARGLMKKAQWKGEGGYWWEEAACVFCGADSSFEGKTHDECDGEAFLSRPRSPRGAVVQAALRLAEAELAVFDCRDTPTAQYRMEERDDARDAFRSALAKSAPQVKGDVIDAPPPAQP